MFYRLLKYVILGPLLRLVFRPRIEGLEHVPESGAAIVAGNHLSFSDHFLMPAILKRRITFLAKAEYFTGPGIKGRLTAAFFRSAGQIPVDRSGKEAGQAAIREGLGVLSKGELLGHLPGGHALARRAALQGQGRRGRDGAQGAGAGDPLRDDRHLRGAAARPGHPEPPPVTIRFGEPLDFSRYAGMEGEKASSARSRTRSCTRSSACPARSTSTSTRPTSRPRPEAAKEKARKFPRTPPQLSPGRFRAPAATARGRPGPGGGRAVPGSPRDGGYGSGVACGAQVTSLLSVLPVSR